MKRNIKRIIFVIAAVAVWVGAFFMTQRLLEPKYMDDLIEGALTAEYYDETTQHDVIFIGDCEVYENFSPVTLWENYGITSYIRGNAQQLIWQSYYLLEDTLRYEKPEFVVFNVLSMKYGEPQSEEYNRLTLDGMELSPVKIKAVEASMTEDEELITYIFPILRYHSRWNQLKGEDFEYFFKKDKISHNGFIMRADVRPATTFPEPEPLADYTLPDTCWEYLDKMAALCKENDIELILIKAPSLYPVWYDQWDEQIVEYAQKNGLAYINLLDKCDEIGIDFYSPETADTYDRGLHLNLSGAEKLSNYFGEWLCSKYQITDHRNDPDISAVYSEKLADYYAMKEDQLRELAEYGELISY